MLPNPYASERLCIYQGLLKVVKTVSLFTGPEVWVQTQENEAGALVSCRGSWGNRNQPAVSAAHTRLTDTPHPLSTAGGMLRETHHCFRNWIFKGYFYILYFCTISRYLLGSDLIKILSVLKTAAWESRKTQITSLIQINAQWRITALLRCEVTAAEHSIVTFCPRQQMLVCERNAVGVQACDRVGSFKEF